MRTVSSTADLAAVGRLVRRAWAAKPGWNAWTFARWDIWSGWRIAELELSGVTAWQDGIALWEENGDVVAAALVGESPRDGVILCDPRRATLVPELLAWLEERGLRVEVRASNAVLVEAVNARGWQLDPSGHHIPREKLLGTTDEDVLLPPGLQIAELEDD